MQERTLGGQGLATSAIGYGAMGISLAYGPGDERQGIAAIQRAHALGVTLFDTAELYGWGDNEKILGRAIAGFRDGIVIASKFGLTRDRGFDSRPQHIREVLDNSLRNLGVDYIDIYYQHRVDPNVSIEEVAGTVKEFIAAGKVKYFGLSEAGPNTIRRAHEEQPVSVLQTEYSLFARDVEELFPVLDSLGIGLVAYSPLARGFLTSSARPSDEYDASDVRANGSPRFPWWQPGSFELNYEITQKLTKLAVAKGVTLSQLALAWLLSRGEHLVPIPGSRHPQRVAENVAAAEICLSEAELETISAAIGDGPYGGRNTEGVIWD